MRLGGIVALKKTFETGSDLCADGQLGVGIPGGVDINIGHVIKAALASDPSKTVVLSFDWAAAFNTTAKLLFEELAESYPSLAPFSNLRYGAHTTLSLIHISEPTRPY